MKIAIVEDEVLIGLFIKDTVQSVLQEEDCVVGIFDSHDALFDFLDAGNSFDLIFMDINIYGDKDGVQTACRLKKEYADIKTVFITSYQSSAMIEKAKSVAPLGYLLKPISEVSIEAMLMVAEAQINESASECLKSVELSSYIYNTKEKHISLNDEQIYLTVNETTCLDTLIKEKNKHIKQETIIKNIWGDENNRVASLREVIFRLRKKLPQLDIQNISKIGYILKV